MARTITGTNTSGITLTSQGDNPVTVAATAVVSKPTGALGALYGKGGTTNTWTIDNFGVISGGLGSTSAGGVYLGGFLNTVTSGVLINETGGTVLGNLYALFVNGPASVTNKTGGTISARSNAAMYLRGLGAVVNAGVITDSTNTGVYLRGGGSLTNNAGGSINAASIGVRLAAVGTVNNAGTISGPGFSVFFGANSTSNRLIANPGATFAGRISGGTGVLELAAGNGSAASLGTFASNGITNFSTLQFDPGAKWTVAGNMSSSGLGTIAITGFTSSDTIDLTGFAATSETFNNNALVLTNASNGTATLHIQGAFSSSNFALSSDGKGGTNIALKSGLQNPIAGTYNTGVTLSSTLGNPISVTGTIDVSSGTALYGPGGGSNQWTIANSGTIAAAIGNGIQLGGYSAGVGYSIVTNRAGGEISGANLGVYIGGPGAVTNLSGGSISGGVYIYGDTSRGPTEGQPNVQVYNAGTLSGAFGIYEVRGGSVTNAAGGSISGTLGSGILLAQQGTVSNSGAVSGAGYGVVLYEGGSATNLQGGTIAGSGGIYIGYFAGIASTFTNAGTVIATDPTADAVRFGNGGLGQDYRLIVDPGAVFQGRVDGGGGTMELAPGASQGTLAGFGSTITNFSSIEFDTGSDWSISGAPAGFANVPITGLAAGDTIDLPGFTAVSETFNNGTLTLTDTASTQVALNFPDKSDISDFEFAHDGAGGIAIAGAGTGQTLSWTSASSHDWNTAGNWSPPSVPGAFDTAVIANPAGSATIAAGASNLVSSLTIVGAADSLTIDGSLDVFGTLAIDTGGTLTDNGTLTAAAIADDGLLVFTGNQMLDNTPLGVSGTLAVQNGGTLTLGPAETVTQTGTVALLLATTKGSESIINQGSIDATFAGGALIIAPPNFVNQGTINAQDETLIIGNGAWSNQGGTIANAAALILAGTLATGDIGTIKDAASVTEAGLLDNTGATLTVGSGSALGTVTLASGGVVGGGTIIDQGGGLALQGGTLDGVTHQGPLELVNPGDAAAIVNALTVTAADGSTPGTIDLTGDGATLDFVTTPTLAGVTINIGASLADVLQADFNGGTFTIGPDVSIATGDAAGLFGSIVAGSGTTLDLDGTLSAISSGGTFTLADTGGTFNNDGSIVVGNGDTLDATTAIAGSGTIEVGTSGVAELSAVAAGQTVKLADASGLLRLEQPANFDATVAGIQSGATIDLANFAAVDKSFANGVLTLTDAAKAQVALHIPGPFTSDEFLTAPDGNGGTDLSWSFLPMIFTWIGGSGDWNTASAWDLGFVPTSGDSAVIGTAGTDTITISSNVGIDGLTLQGAGDTLTIPVGGALTAGPITISAGTLQVIDTLAATQITDHGVLDIVATHELQNTPLLLGGTLQLSSAFGLPGTLTLGAGEVVTQDGPSALITSSGNKQNAVVNQGAIDAGIAGGAMTIAVPDFLNQGTIAVSNGETLDMASAVAGGGTIALGTGTADFSAGVAAGQTLAFTDGAGVLGLADPASFGAAITGFATDDAIDLTGIAADKAAWSAGALTISNAGTTVATLSLPGDYSSFVFNVAGDGAAGSLVTATCFAAGTRILTPRGEIAIERLQEGDLVTTISGETQRISWVGRRQVNLRRHPNRRRILPVRVSAHAFAPGQPKRDLLLSPDHAVLVEGVLIPIRHLINGSTVVQISRAAITYYHVELPRHDVVLANGMPAESYLEAGARDAFANGGSVLQLHPDFTPPQDHYAMLWELHGYAPLVVAGDALERARSALARQTMLAARA